MPGLDASAYTAMLNAPVPRGTAPLLTGLTDGTAPLQRPSGARYGANLARARDHHSGSPKRAGSPPEAYGERQESDNALQQWQDFKFRGVTPVGVCCPEFVTAASRTAGLGVWGPCPALIALHSHM